jgi:hypothetical protein
VASITEDIITATKQYWTNTLSTAASVELAFQDERSQDVDDTDEPRVIISLIDIEIDNSRRLSGISRAIYDPAPGEPGNVSITSLPIPINWHFQIDTYNSNRKTGWAMDEAILELVGDRFKYITLGSDKLYLIPLEIVPMLGPSDGQELFRTTFRYMVQHWVASSDEARLVAKVLVLKIVKSLDTVEVR